MTFLAYATPLVLSRFVILIFILTNTKLEELQRNNWTQKTLYDHSDETTHGGTLLHPFYCLCSLDSPNFAHLHTWFSFLDYVQAMCERMVGQLLCIIMILVSTLKRTKTSQQTGPKIMMPTRL